MNAGKISWDFLPNIPMLRPGLFSSRTAMPLFDAQPMARLPNPIFPPAFAQPTDCSDRRSRISAASRWMPCRRSEEHTAELQSLMPNSYAVFCLKNKTHNKLDNKETKHKIQHTN